MSFENICEEEKGRPFLLKETLLARIEGSVGSESYRKFFVLGPKGPIDVCFNGDVSCAYFMSTLLYSFGLETEKFHTYVDPTVEDMLRSGWIEDDTPATLTVVVWGEKMGDDGEPHKHIGFCLDEEYCVSNDPVSRSPKKHRILDLKKPNGEPRPVIGYYSHPSLV